MNPTVTSANETLKAALWIKNTAYPTKLPTSN